VWDAVPPVFGAVVQRQNGVHVEESGRGLGERVPRRRRSVDLDLRDVQHYSGRALAVPSPAGLLKQRPQTGFAFKSAKASPEVR
jgi:hypothetical protein